MLPSSEDDYLQTQINHVFFAALGGVNPSITDFSLSMGGKFLDFGLVLDCVSLSALTNRYKTLPSGMVQISNDIINAMEWVAGRYRTRQKSAQQVDC
jgi:hypothetical protein